MRTADFLFQQNLPLVFGRTMLWKWLNRSCFKCTLQAAHFCLAFSFLFPHSVLRIDMTDHCLRSRKLDQDRSKSSQY